MCRADGPVFHVSISNYPPRVTAWSIPVTIGCFGVGVGCASAFREWRQIEDVQMICCGMFVCLSAVGYAFVSAAVLRRSHCFSRSSNVLTCAVLFHWLCSRYGDFQEAVKLLISVTILYWSFSQFIANALMDSWTALCTFVSAFVLGLHFLYSDRSAFLQAFGMFQDGST